MSSSREALVELVERYRVAFAKREEGIQSFLDGEGDLKEGQSLNAYDEHSRGAWNDSHGDLGSFLSELRDLLGARLKVGDRVTVAADAVTALGGWVYFAGEVVGTVIAEFDEDGDVEVRSDGGMHQYVASRYVSLIET
ncbi:hypothetical protein [Streptomyces sp. NPDC048057]|uniref:hypothetical protein n=1 Tax=Streptomyces sp. NPDC048057 TaxID=3155628 RepID=UPI0033F879EF